ncbi:hypothetical protein [Roseivirga sp. E12]|uniref:hypothetical protein n=1 Tax=Roseivirga sp. E12 TaxID=2819237 RepID=UPI001ABC895C|nr:hypothetical protein [Roseivirga sp. E12]MBO3700635.1 hypothetical protein [Roseivirga sp. E12]
MVKNSKYILTLALLLGVLSAKAQSFSAVNRDMEITRVTLENFLKKWDGDPLLNKITNTEAEYKKGQGVTFKVDAPNADILMNTQGGIFRSGDQGMMDTFYTQEIISLQQERLIDAIIKFITDFNSYIPHLDGNEDLKVVFEVKDSEVKKNGKVLPPSPKASERAYVITAKWNMKDLKDLKEGKLEADLFAKKITVEKD